jgi:hypothetical protein
MFIAGYQLDFEFGKDDGQLFLFERPAPELSGLQFGHAASGPANADNIAPPALSFGRQSFPS